MVNLSIIIVNYKTKEKTINCIKSIRESNLSGLDYEIIVVDNNSIDDSLENIKNSCADIKFIQSKINLGMGGGNNLGIKEAKGEFILILNPDTVVKKEAIKNLYFYISENKKIGVVAPMLLYPDNSLQYSCFREWKIFTPIYRRTFLGKFNNKHLDNFLMKDFNHKDVMEIDWAMGSCLLIRKEILDKIGVFDERFFMYFEDTDLCRRIRKAGYKVIYNPKAIVIHDHARESAEKSWFIAPFIDRMAREHIKSWIKYFWKWRIRNN